MAGGTSVPLLRDIQILFDSGTAGGLSDRQLLERFAGGRDASSEAAFEVLVLRHGPMVLRVCRNLLHDPNDAHDAFQATFLVLVKRRGSIGHLESVGGWLFGVASRVASRARVDAARRRAAEHRAACRVVEAVDPPEDHPSDRDELGPVVEEEVRRLPEKYRSVVVLCYWRGLTQEQAAAQLGCPIGTVRSRLARARGLLRRRLTRRGLAPLAEVITSVSIPRLPAVPPDLTLSTIRAAIQIAAGQATRQAASGLVASLVHRALWSMTMVKINGVAAGVVLIGLAGYGAGLAAQRAGAPRPARPAGAPSDNKGGPSGQPAQSPPGTVKKESPTEAGKKTPRFAKVYSRVEGQATIIAIRPDGTAVKKGEVVIELDSARLRDQLVNQKITTKSAEANYQNAKLTREVAEIAVVEYKEGIFPSDQARIQGRVKLAEAEMDLAKEELKAAQASRDRLTIKRGEVAELRARLALEKAESRLRTLLEYTKGKTIRELQNEAEKARSNELARQATWELEKSKEEKLEKQIASCTIKAPIDGFVEYAREGQQIREGLIVRGGQRLFDIVPAAAAKAETQ